MNMILCNYEEKEKNIIMAKIGFDLEKYLRLQSERILERVHTFGGKLYLEFGGKLFDDYHASRVLPGFLPDSKMKVLLQLKDQAEIVIAINAAHIEMNKRRGDLGITYDLDVMRLIDTFRSIGLYVGSVVITQYAGQHAADLFQRKLEALGVKVYRHYPIADYPSNIGLIVSDDGYGRNAYIEGYRVGGKTGTSEKLDEYDENGQQVKDKIVSFVGVAPIDDPKYVVLVALDTPAYSENSEKYTVHGMYISGGLMAAPTVRDIFLDILPYLGVEPDYGSEDIRGVNFTVPDVIGMDETEAGELLAEKTIPYRVVGSGSVVTDQLPVAGSQVPGNSQIILYMGAEKQATRVEVPDFIGCSVADVNYLASNAGLYVQAKGTDRTDVYVLAAYQDIDPGTEVDRGTTITVEFSSTGASD